MAKTQDGPSEGAAEGAAEGAGAWHEAALHGFAENKHRVNPFTNLQLYGENADFLVRLISTAATKLPGRICEDDSVVGRERVEGVCPPPCSPREERARARGEGGQDTDTRRGQAAGYSLGYAALPSRPGATPRPAGLSFLSMRTMAHTIARDGAPHHTYDMT